MTAPARWATRILIVLMVIALALLPYVLLSLPDRALGQGTPAARRALQRITDLSTTTRTPGAPNHDAARDALAAELRGLGLAVEIQRVKAAGIDAPLENIVARRAGQGADHHAVLLVAHYDSDPAGPGASDNASGVAVVIEIARALAAQPAPRNDLMVLLTDAEELGVRGAPEFIAGHAWVKDVRVALNFDGLSTGPVFLWQTGAGNGRLIEHYAATPRPMAASWVDGIARLLPLDTDMRPFLEAGIGGGSFTSPYLPPQDHTPLDQPGLVRLATLEHGIQQGAALAGRLLADDLAQPKAPDRAYLNLCGSGLVTFPAAAAAGLGLLAGLVLLGVLAFALAGKSVRPGALGSGALFTAANMLLGALLMLAVELTLFVKQWITAPWLRIPLEVGIFCLLLAWGYRRLARRNSPSALLLGAQIVWGILVVWSSLADPLFSPLLTLILLASLVPHGLNGRRGGPLARRVAIWAALFVILLLGAPVVYMLFMISGMLMIPAMLGAMVAALLVGLVMPLLDLEMEAAHAGAA